MSRLVLFLLTAVAMIAFAANSLLCRIALRDAHVDAATFTLLRLAAGAVVLAVLAGRRGSILRGGDWGSACALFGYAALLAFAYRGIPTGVGALLLFGAVQATMIGAALARGHRLARLQWLGCIIALAGLAVLLGPGWTAPDPFDAALMLASGVCWGVYSLQGRTAGDATAATAGNFLRAAPLAAVLATLVEPLEGHADAIGVGCAVASGAIASGLGYTLWYRLQPRLAAATAATVQLTAPLLATAAGVAWLREPLSPALIAAAAAILGGVALVTRAPGRPTGL